VYPIVAKTVLSPTIVRFVITAPFIARKRKAGNFVMVRVEDHGERIPLTIADGDPHAGTITLIVQAVGKTTKLLCSRNVGDSLLDVVGPLGNPTPIALHGKVVCVGGGVGTAELFPIARALKEAGNTVTTIVGARSQDLIILEREMREFSDAVYVTTDDGTYGRKGFVTEQLKDILDSSPDIGAVFAIGPLPMMKAVANLTKPYGVHTLVSLNTIMVDGTGMCGGCRVTIDGKMKFACVDGPEFDGHQVDFDELMMRNRSYLTQEQTSSQLHVCRLTALAEEMGR
jgi:ferredoxin/flavodoxin---NADP+ reductase